MKVLLWFKVLFWISVSVFFIGLFVIALGQAIKNNRCRWFNAKHQQKAKYIDDLGHRLLFIGWLSAIFIGPFIHHVLEDN